MQVEYEQCRLLRLADELETLSTRFDPQTPLWLNAIRFVAGIVPGTSRSASMYYFMLMQQLIAPVLDAVLIGVMFLAMPHLSQRLSQVDPVNTLLMLLAYVAMVLGTYLIKLPRPAHLQSKTVPLMYLVGNQASPPMPAKSSSSTDDSDWGKEETTGCVTFLALPYGLFVLAAMLISGGYLGVDEPLLDVISRWTQGNPWLITAVCLGFLIFVGSFIFCIVHTPARRLEPASSAGMLVRALGLAGVNAMALFTAAWWDGYLMGADNSEMGFATRVFVFVVIFLLYLLFWAPPRLVLLAHDPGRYARLSFLAATAVAAARVVF